jgi:hypothetical protein
MPFVVFPDRMALTDGMQTATVALLLLAALSYARVPSYRDAALLALLLPAAILVKESSVIFIPFPLLCVLLAQPGKRLVGLAGVVPALLAGLAVLAVLVRRGYAWQFSEKTRASGLGERLDLLEANARNIVDWYWILLTPPLFLLAAGALVWLLIVRPRREHLLLVTLLGLTVLPYLVSASTLFPRYLHFSAVPLALLGGRSLQLAAEWLGTLPRRAAWSRPAAGSARAAALALLLVGVSVWPLRADVTIATAPERARLPAIDRGQYVSGWPSGYGTREAAEFLKTQARVHSHGITVMRLHYEDQPNQALDLYLPRSDRISVATFNPGQPEWLAEVERLAAERPTFFVFSPQRDRQAYDTFVSRFADATLVWQMPRPGGAVGLEIWSVPASGEG